MTLLRVMHDGKAYAINHIRSADLTFPISDVPDLSLTSINRDNNPGYSFLQEEAIIKAHGHEWRIRQLKERSHYKTVKALHTVMDLDDIPFDKKLSGSYPPNILFSTILGGTGYTFNSLLSEYVGTVELEDFGLMSVWQAFKEAIKLIGCEFTIKPNKVFEIRNQLSSDSGQQLRYGRDIKNLARNTDSNDIVTEVIVYYDEDYSSKAVFSSSTAPNYSRTFTKIVKDSRITTLAGAEKRANREFRDLDISYEVDCIAHARNFNLGESVWTVYEILDDLKLRTRVLKTKYSWFEDEFLLSEVTVGNTIFQTESDIILDRIDSTKRDSEVKLEEAKKSLTIKFDDKMVDQYNDITTEYTSAISISAQQLRSDFTAEITTVKGDITVIQNDVSTLVQTANEISATVSSHTMELGSLGTRMTSAESSLVIQAGQISSKVSQTDYNGNVISSLINQTATTVSIKAEKINFEGAVISQGSITGLTTINVGTDLYVGNNIYMAQNVAGFGNRSIFFNRNSQISGGMDSLELSSMSVSINAASTYFEGGHVSFANVTSINWGSHAPVARFG